MTKKISFNRADINSAISAAKTISITKTCYVYATYNGFVIGYSPAPFNQKCYKVTPEKVELIGGLQNA